MPFVSKIPNKCWWINTSILYTIIRYITINNMQHTAYLKKLTISAEHSDVCSINIMFEILNRKYFFLLKECFTLHFNFLCPLHLLVASFVWEKKKHTYELHKISSHSRYTNTSPHMTQNHVMSSLCKDNFLRFWIIFMATFLLFMATFLLCSL